MKRKKNGSINSLFELLLFPALLPTQPTPMRNSTASKMMKRKNSAKRSSKTGFESFLELDTKKDVSAREDLELERKLAKKLRVKGGKLGGEDDEFNLLFEDIPSVIDSLREEGITEADEFPVKTSAKSSKKRKKRKPSQEQGLEEADGEGLALEEAPAKVRSRKKHKKKKELLEQDHEAGVEESEPVETAGTEIVSEEAPATATALEGSVKYVAPHSRSRAGNEIAEHHQIRRQIRGMRIFGFFFFFCFSPVL